MPSTPRDLPPLQSLVVFEAAARHLSFTQAARELGTSQPAVSHQVRRLEAYLGVALFQRLYRRVALTPEGRQLFDAVETGLGTMMDAVSRLRSPKRHARIDVATDFGFAAFWLLPRLPLFRERYPAIDVRIITSQREFELRTDPVDVAIVFGAGKHPHGAATRLFAEEVYPVCSPRHLEGQPAIRAARDLVTRPLLHLEDDGRVSGGGDRWFNWRSWLRAAGIDSAPNDPRLSFDNYTLLIQAAIAGQGIALGWASLVDHLIRKGQLVRALDLSFTTRRGYFLLLPMDRTPTPDSLAFHDWVLSEQTSATTEPG
jgi:LysR family transcriptional regulator, glycine cleavage system transcriptional activator